jgi:SWI/SNF-related matrix-associated actin-dependent regulator of chromatin subfamily A-like protein 1
MRIIKDTYPQLFDFQKEGVDFLANHRSALLADQLGIGKSAQAIHAAQQVGARSILVICPASIKYNWRKEGVKWGYSEDDIYIIDRGVKTLPETGMFIINYDLIWRKKYVKLLAKREYDVLICDECHHVKNHRAKRSKAVWLKDGYCDKSIYRWMLTATPVLNRPVELHPMLSKLCPKRLGEYKNYIDYTRRYCRGHDGNWGWNATGADNLQELSGRLTGFMLRRTRDCLPDKTLQKIYMPTTKEIEKQLFSGNETDSIRRKIGIGKIKPSVEHIKNILEDEDKVIVFAFHRDVIEGLEEELKEYNPVKLYGSTSQKERQKSINKFSTDDETRVFIGQIQAAGEGIDGLQNKCSVGIFVEICHTPGVINQAMGRLHRQGQKSKCLFQYLIVENSIDEKVLNSTIFKEKNIQTIMKDKDRGLKFNRGAGIAEKLKTTKQPKHKKIKENSVGDIPSLRHPNKPEEVGMSIEKSLERIAESNEKIQKALTAIIGMVASGVKETPQAKPKTKAKPKKETPKKEPPKKESLEEKPKDYKTQMNEVANKISGHYNDPVKTNKAFAEINQKFKKEFPNYNTVLDVKEKDQPAVINLINGFLKAKGISA